jgi:hypothetical protein
MVEHERGEEAVGRFRKLVNESSANSFNKELFGDMILLAYFFSFISLLIARERKTELIAWFSDRDSMTEWCDGVLWNMALEDIHGFAEYLKIAIPTTEFLPIGMPDPTTGEMWFDHLVRLADYIAGSLAVWDTKNNQVPTTPKSDKFLKVIEEVIADSDNLVVLGLNIGDEGVQWKRLQVVKAPDDEQDV